MQNFKGFPGIGYEFERRHLEQNSKISKGQNFTKTLQEPFSRRIEDEYAQKLPLKWSSAQGITVYKLK